MNILRADAQPVTAWKNGGGRTRAVAIGPAGATIDDFAWRISVAEVAADGPFSEFAGVDRTLVLLAGAGMALDGPGGGARLVLPGDRWDFPGEWPVTARLLDGPTLDLNLMVRRGRAAAPRVVVAAVGAALDGVAVVVAGEARVGDAVLRVGDAAIGRGVLRGAGRVARVSGLDR